MHTMILNPLSDISDILGAFEQQSFNRGLHYEKFKFSNEQLKQILNNETINHENEDMKIDES